MPVQIGQKPEHGFDEPLGLLSDCHRRIERFLEIMLRVARSERSSALSGASRDAMQQALQYFRVAGPRHTADEEESLFPVLRTSSEQSDAAHEVLERADELEQEHRILDSAHAVVDELASQWLDGPLSEEEAGRLIHTLESLRNTYERHIGFEDRELFPAAAQILTPEQIEGIGRQMAERRGVPFRPGSHT